MCPLWRRRLRTQASRQASWATPSTLARGREDGSSQPTLGLAQQGPWQLPWAPTRGLWLTEACVRSGDRAAGPGLDFSPHSLLPGHSGQPPRRVAAGREEHPLLRLTASPPALCLLLARAHIFTCWARGFWACAGHSCVLITPPPGICQQFRCSAMVGAACHGACGAPAGAARGPGWAEVGGSRLDWSSGHPLLRFVASVPGKAGLGGLKL